MKKGVSPLGFRLAAVALVAVLALSCSGGDEASDVDEGDEMSIEVTSSVFTEGSNIPSKYTCDGEDVSPPIAWSGVPEDTNGLALIVDDPDARGTWVHWVLFNIPADVTELPEAMPAGEITPFGINGTNDFKRLGYGGPCPPSGSHRYVFKLYALDTDFIRAGETTNQKVEEMMEGHILARGQLMGRYERQ